MAYIRKFTAAYYDWNGGTEATSQKADNFCNSINAINTGGWVFATPIQGVHGSTPIYCPSIIVGDYTLRISGQGDAGIYKNDTYVDGLDGSMSGQCHTIVVVYDSNFVHFLIHGCYNNTPTTASMAISCINFNGHHVSGTRCLGHLGNEFNSLNSMKLYDNETYWHFNNEYSEAAGETEIKVGYQTLYNGNAHSTTLDIGLPFITCQTLPIYSDAWNHKIVKFDDTEYYAVGTNTLIQIQQ